MSFQQEIPTGGQFYLLYLHELPLILCSNGAKKKPLGRGSRKGQRCFYKNASLYQNRPHRKYRTVYYSNFAALFSILFLPRPPNLFPLDLPVSYILFVKLTDCLNSLFSQCHTLQVRVSQGLLDLTTKQMKLKDLSWKIRSTCMGRRATFLSEGLKPLSCTLL